MRTKRHTVLEMLAWLLLLASYGIAIYGMRHLPKTIATHYALDGTPDGYCLLYTSRSGRIGRLRGRNLL